MPTLIPIPTLLLRGACDAKGLTCRDQHGSPGHSVTDYAHAIRHGSYGYLALEDLAAYVNRDRLSGGCFWQLLSDWYVAALKQQQQPPPLNLPIVAHGDYPPHDAPACSVSHRCGSSPRCEECCGYDPD